MRSVVSTFHLYYIPYGANVILANSTMTYEPRLTSAQPASI